MMTNPNDYEFVPEIDEMQNNMYLGGIKEIQLKTPTNEMPTFDEVEQMIADGKIHMLTRSGSINLTNIQGNDIVITDIAHALTYQVTRWINVGEGFYPVAKHALRCVDVARRDYSIIDPYQLMCLLMHDASEAYLCDLPRHAKRLMRDYLGIEDNLMQHIAVKFNFPWPMPPLLEQIDMVVQRHEYETNIMNRVRTEFDLDAVYYDFMTEFHELWDMVKTDG